MKKINLIGWLSRNSHEKQSPQRLRRYAVMLLMLLTLGVGQMWADSSVKGASIKYDNGSSHWWNVSSTPKDLGQVYTFTLKGFWAQLGTENVCQNTCIYYGLTSACSLGSYNIKDPNDWSPSTKHFQTESMNVNILSGLTPNKYTLYAKFIGHGKKSGNDCGEISSSTYQMKFEYPAYLTGDGTWCGTEWNTTADAQKMTYNAGGYYSKTVSSVTQADHKLKVSTYNWASSWGHAKYDATNSSNVYSESNASGNIQFQPAMAGDVTIKFNISDQKISIICAAPTITLDDEGGSGGSGTQNTYYNVATSNVSVPTKTGYIFGGYYDGDDGTGNQIINASGVWQKNKSNFTDNSSTPKWIVRANHTLHAKWLPQSLTITSHPTYLTTTDKLNLSISYENIPEGYCYRVKVGGGYWNNSLNQDRDAISGSGSTTFTSYAALPVAANTVVVELWKNDPFAQQTVVSDPVTVTVEPGWEVGVQAKTDDVISTAGGTVSPSSVSPTAHIGQTITASEPNTGYNFTGWTADPDNYITFDDASALSTTVKATAGGTVYANYTRQVGSYSTTFYAGDHGSINAKGTEIAKNGNASVTIGNNEALSATPESAEYVFDHWGTTGSVSVANIYSATTTVTATAAGGTVTAYYRHIPVLGAVTATPSGTQNYAGSPIDFALSVTSTYMAHPVVVFLVNDGTTTYEVVGAPYGADGSSAAGTIGDDASNTTVHKATFTASAAKSYTVSAKLYEGELMDNFEGENTRGWAGDNLNSGFISFADNPGKMAGNGSNKVLQVTRTSGAEWGGAIMLFVANTVEAKTTCDAAGSNDYAYIHARMKDATDATHLKNNDAAGNTDDINPTFDGATSSDWRHVTYHNTHCSNNFLFFMIQRGNADDKTVYIDDIILSNEETMTVKASQAATASFSINWNYTVTLNNNGATSAGTESVNVTYGSATGITDITVPTKTGYTFGGYYTADAGAGTLQINASGVWQNAAYVADGKWNSGSNQTLYAKWTENMRNVTISAGTGGTVDKTSASVGVATTTTVTATAYPGYRFTGWTATDCSVASTSSASTTLSGNGTTGDATLVANFARTYAYIEGRMTVYNAARTSETHTASSKGGWDESSTRIEMEYDETNHRFYRHTYKTPAELKAQINSQDQWFSVKTGTVHNSFASGTVKAYHPSSNTNIATAGTKYSAPTTATTYNFKFTNTATDGYVVIYFDEAGVWYELEQSLKYNANGGSGDAPTPTYYLKGTNATAASNPFTARAYYTFGGWNTDQYITGTNYDAGASVPMNANTTLYAKWTRTVTLNQEDATTLGTTSVTGTYNCATLPTIINPSKTGYTFGGWYTQIGGGGNLVINTSGVLQSGVYHWTDQTTPSNRFDRTTTKDGAPLYAKWTQTVTLNANLANHGSGDNTSATIVYKATAKTSITHCTPATGYHLLGYYTAETDGVKVLNADGSFASSAVTDYITDGKWTKAGATTLYAHYEPNTYDVILDVNGATTGSNQTVVATFDDDMPTTQKTSGDAITAPSKTGYTFGGYWTNVAGTGTQYYTGGLASSHVWDVATNNTTIYAKWTANPYTITLTQSGETGYGSAGTASVTATYDAALPTISSLPTAANGYAFMGYYTGHNGTGTQYYGADGTKLVATYTTADALELFAYFKKAEVTEISFSPAAVVAPNTTITATPTISPTPTGTHIVCWEVQYSNGTALPSQPTFTPGASNSVSFSAPSASATYRLQATLRTGSSCSVGTELCVYSTTFQVAGEHTVTVRYQDESGRTLKDTIHITGKPLEWTTLGDITPPTITGYKFDHWDAGDGVTIKNGESTTTTTTTSSIQIKAVYDGTLTAVYAKKRLIFFNNTLGWNKVYVYFYKNDSYWESTGSARGSGANGTFPFTSYPFSENYWGEMTQIEGTNIYYFDAEKKGVNASYDDVVFTKDDQYGYDYFSNTKAVRRGDYKSTTLPMFVPINSVSETKNGTKYYNHGYWMNYPENTGYTLLIYNQKAKAGATKLYEIPFEFTEDYTMPMELKVDLEAGQTYGFEIYRADGTYFSTTTTITANTSNWGLYKDQTSYCGLQTTAAGDYTFSLFYDGEYRVGVTYPVAVNDYRIVYTDVATWSKTAHTESWNHPSRVITKNSSATEVKKDTVSFFWTYGSTPAIKYQICTAVAAGSASWNAGTAIDVSGFSSVLTKEGVYNFIFEQPAGGASISLIGVEPYTGKYYIRTDCAGSTKWSNFQSTDHEMTYSDYTKENHGYSHYYTHWVTTGQNVKFCIANDYSQCITDTLVEDKGTVVADITTEGNANAGRLNSGNASIRFMWNQTTNKISRAYISGSTNISDRFLVLEGDAKMFDAEGNALSISGLNANEINLVDDQNFVYEREIKVQTGARAKLTAKYNTNIQYFKGSEGAFAEGTTIELLGGDADGKHTMRIVYDFKTNRLVTAYVPSGTIEDDIAINADLMIVREHQEEGQQLRFNGGSLSEVHTVYGVMRFNRWTLNNKEKTGSHDPVGDPKSAYERGLYWISFPFNVNLSDVFGFGTYGTHWIIMEYDGAERASKGYWRDSEGFWKYVTNRTDKVLEAGKGYVLALDLDLMKSDNTSFWTNNIEQVELFFPSAAYVENIESTNVTTTVDEHACTIDRTNNNGPDINKNRTRADSHWNIIGIPSYANYGETLKAGAEGEVITWNSSPYTNDLPFLYEWSTVDNTYSVQSGTTYPFKAMHAYMVQYHGDLYWSLASATPPSSIVARRTYAEKPQNVEMRIELQQNEKAVDQTFVKLSNDENVSTNFAFDEDLCKEYNANKANIYTIVENYLPVAGNTMPMSDQTTVVPVGVKIAADGEYTFAIPEGTEGIGVVLIDNIAGTRTNLGLMDYSVTLEQGQIDNRFLLEISPIVQSPTGIELLNGENGENGVRKVLIDNILYIVKDGIVYDAQGHRVQ